MPTFIDKLQQASRRNDSLLCVGLDPDPALMPRAGLLEFNKAIIQATQDLVCAYKPNVAFYETLGMEGLRALEKTLAAIPSHIPVIGDAKRGDVASTAQKYATALFTVWGYDAVTVNPYLGRDAIEPFLAFADRGVLLVCRTSNLGATDFQSLLTAAPEDAPGVALVPLYERIAMRAAEWNTSGNIGLVVGATYPEELRRVRTLCPRMPILVPGVGAQGGDLEASVRYGADARGERVVISASRQVLYASTGPGYAEASRQAALHLVTAMRKALAKTGPRP